MSHTQARRPYYQTSKEEFELMTAVVRHFLPDVTMEKEALREAVAGFSNAPVVAVDKCGEVRKEPESATQSGEISREVAIRVDSPAASVTPSSPVPPMIEPLNAEDLVILMAQPLPDLDMRSDQGDPRLDCDSMGIPRACCAARCNNEF